MRLVASHGQLPLLLFARLPQIGDGNSVACKAYYTVSTETIIVLLGVQARVVSEF
jgi:hypothetical protein